MDHRGRERRPKACSDTRTRPGLRALPALVAAALAGACASAPVDPFAGVHWLSCHRQAGLSLRGLSAVSATTAWASGTKGTVLRTIDGGSQWQQVGPPEAAALDLRDVEAFDADRALVISIEKPARIWSTSDGGRTWRVVHTGPDAAFFDALAFDGPRGVLFGDPHDGAHFALASDDAGATWRALATLPAPVGAEAGFAASGTCVAMRDGVVWIATGGTVARVLRSGDGGASWTTAALPLVQGEASTGAFSVAAWDDGAVVVVGGDYRKDDGDDRTAAWSDDGGRTFTASTTGAGGYRSGVATLGPGFCIAVGPNGTSVSRDGGRTFTPFAREGFHTVAAARDGTVWAAGSEGRIARLGALEGR